MSYIGICEYVIGIIYDRDIWYYAGTEGDKDNYSSDLGLAVRYDDTDDLRDQIPKLSKTLTVKILEIQKCPRCGKEFTEPPAISREDNKTEICPECGVKEAVRAYMEHEEGK